MKLSIVTVNYNGSRKTIKLLESLKSQTNKDFGIVLVDNGSDKSDQDEIDKWIKDNFFEVVILKNKENLGFSGGCNSGIKKALDSGADWIILLNNDTWVENDFIFGLRNTLNLKKDIVGLAMEEDGGFVAYGGYLEWLKPTLSHNHGLISRNHAAGQFKYAIGGGMAISRTALEKLGGFDENFFLYFEDADLSMRAVKLGMKIYFPAGPIVHHTVSASTRSLGAPLLLRYHFRNALYFNIRNGPRWVQILLWPWSWLIILRQMIKIMTGIKRKESKAILAGVMDFYFNRMGKINA